MNTKTIHDLTVAYIENALSETKLLHDAALIEPTLRTFNIERRHARLSGFSPRPGKFRPRAGMRPRPVYSVLGSDGAPLGDSVSEHDLDGQYAEQIIVKAIDANRAAMLADHADLEALHRAGSDAGAAPTFRYQPSNGLAERTTSDGNLARRKDVQMQAIAQLQTDREDEQRRLNSVRESKRKAEAERENILREVRRLLNQKTEAQRVISRAHGIQSRMTPQPQTGRSFRGTTITMEHDDGPELG